MSDRAAAQLSREMDLDGWQPVFEAAPDAWVLLGPDGHVRRTNARAGMLFGRSEAELAGLSAPALVEEGESALRLALKGPQTGRVLLPEGSRLVTITASKASLTDGEGLLIAVRPAPAAEEAQSLRDELATTTEALHRATLELQQFAKAVSHDLREPVRLISSFVQLLAEDFGGSLDDQARSYMGYILDASTRLNDRMAAALDYHRIISERLEKVDIDLNEMLTEVQHRVQPAIDSTQARIRVGQLPTIAGARERLTQLFEAILDNAIKFRHPDRQPEITVEASQEKGFVSVCVSDNGIGIKPEDHKRALALFDLLHHRSRYPGRGAGLTLARRIAEMHGGSLTLRSEPGRGTDVLVRLPAK